MGKYIDAYLGSFEERFPEDIDIILKAAKERGMDPPSRQEVDYLYSVWSEDTWCAGWMSIGDKDDPYHCVTDFLDWMEALAGEPEG